jgi:hypothetical protein
MKLWMGLTVSILVTVVVLYVFTCTKFIQTQLSHKNVLLCDFINDYVNSNNRGKSHSQFLTLNECVISLLDQSVRVTCFGLSITICRGALPPCILCRRSTTLTLNHSSMPMKTHIGRIINLLAFKTCCRMNEEE